MGIPICSNESFKSVIYNLMYTVMDFWFKYIQCNVSKYLQIK